MSTTKTQHQPARAMRHGTKGSYASNETSKSITPPSTSASTNDRKAPEAKSDPRPAYPTPVSSVKPYNTPGKLLKAASEMVVEDAGKLLLQELQYHGWKDASLEMIKPNSRFCISWNKPQVAYWIERFTRLFSFIGERSFYDWEHLASLWCSAIDAANEYDDVKALEFASGSDIMWKTPCHARRIRSWLLGNLWPCIVVEPPISDTLAVWFKDFRAQNEAERDILRCLWHDEQRAFDELPEAILLRDSSGFFDSQPVDKNSILGLKKVFAPRDEDLSLCVVSPPWTNADGTSSEPSSTQPTTSEPSSRRPTRRLASDPLIPVRKRDIHGDDTGLIVDFSKDYATECRKQSASIEARPDQSFAVGSAESFDRKCFAMVLLRLADTIDQLFDNQEQELLRRAMREDAAHQLAKLTRQVNRSLINEGWHRVREELYQKGHTAGALRTLEVLAEHGYAHEVAGHWYPALEFLNAEDCQPAPADPDGTSKDMVN